MGKNHRLSSLEIYAGKIRANELKCITTERDRTPFRKDMGCPVGYPIPLVGVPYHGTGSPMGSPGGGNPIASHAEDMGWDLPLRSHTIPQ